MLELRHLKTLIALAETGNLSKAAKRVHLSQPALSHHVRAIEEGYGLELFERKSSPLRLTPAGLRLTALAYEIYKRIGEAEQDLTQIAAGSIGQLRIAVECHSCFDWLMPSMDIFREKWPNVELDLVSGFHHDPVGLLDDNRAEVVIVSQATKRSAIKYHPLFRYEVFALLGKQHSLAKKPYLTAKDFATETLVTYPIPDERLDLIREVLQPAKVLPTRRTTELTVAILQLVASGRGVAALPGWTVQPYLDRKYVVGKPIGRQGLHSHLYAASSAAGSAVSFIREFIDTTRDVCIQTLQHIDPSPPDPGR
jgi:LysR family transcriptional regulator, regulator for metE and metH